MATKGFLIIENKKNDQLDTNYTRDINLPRIIQNSSDHIQNNKKNENESLGERKSIVTSNNLKRISKKQMTNYELYALPQPRKSSLSLNDNHLINYRKDRSRVLEYKLADSFTNQNICCLSYERSKSAKNLNNWIFSFRNTHNQRENLMIMNNKKNSFKNKRILISKGEKIDENERQVNCNELFNSNILIDLSQEKSYPKFNLSTLEESKLPCNSTGKKNQRNVEPNSVKNQYIPISFNLDSRRGKKSSDLNASYFNDTFNLENNQEKDKEITCELKILNKDMAIPIKIKLFKKDNMLYLEKLIKRELIERNYIRENSIIRYINPEILSKNACIKDLVDKNSSIIEIIINSNNHYCISLNGFINRTEMPILPDNYLTFPTKFDIYCMGKQELKLVEFFTIRNQHGEITWEGKTDISNVDFSSDVEIRQSELLVYDKDKVKKPRLGYKLNKRAKITLYNIIKNERPDLISLNDKINYLKRKCKQNGSYYINYNSRNDSVSFKVEHFTKYSFAHLIKQKESKNPQEENKNIEKNDTVNTQNIIPENSKENEENIIERSFKEDMTDEKKNEILEFQEPLRVFKINNEERENEEKISVPNDSHFLFELLEEKELQNKGKITNKIIQNKKKNAQFKFCIKPLWNSNNDLISFADFTNSNSNICKINKNDNFNNYCDSVLDNKLNYIIQRFSQFNNKTHGSTHSYIEEIKSNEIREILKDLSKSNNLANSLIFGLLYFLFKIPEGMTSKNFYNSKMEKIYNYRIKSFYEFMIKYDREINHAIDLEKNVSETDLMNFFLTSTLHSNNISGFNENDFKKYLEKDGLTEGALYSKLHKKRPKNWISELKGIMQTIKFSSVNDILKEFIDNFSKEREIFILEGDDGLTYNLMRINAILEFFTFYDLSKYDKILERYENEGFDSKVPWILSVCIPILLKEELKKSDNEFFDNFVESERKIRNCLINQLKNEQQYYLLFLLSQLDFYSYNQRDQIESEVELFSRISLGVFDINSLNEQDQLLNQKILEDSVARRYYYSQDYINALKILKKNSKNEELQNIFEFKLDELILCNQDVLSDLKQNYEQFFLNNVDTYLNQNPLDIFSILVTKNEILLKIQKVFEKYQEISSVSNLEIKNEEMKDSNLFNLDQIKDLFDSINQLSKRICQRITIEKDEFIKGLIKCQYNSFIDKVSSLISFLNQMKVLNYDLLQLIIENGFSNREQSMELFELYLQNELLSIEHNS